MESPGRQGALDALVPRDQCRVLGGEGRAVGILPWISLCSGMLSVAVVSSPLQERHQKHSAKGVKLCGANREERGEAKKDRRELTTSKINLRNKHETLAASSGRAGWITD